MIQKLVKLQWEYTSSDEISYYKTVDFKKTFVSEYILAILADNREWGYIDLSDSTTGQKDKIEYRYGTIKSAIRNDWTNKIVTDVEYAGGWSRGDWRIITKSM